MSFDRSQPPIPPSGMPPGTPSPQMAPPLGGGHYPGQTQGRGTEVWGAPIGQNWRFDAATSLWQWVIRVPVLNVRPGLMQTLGNAGIVSPLPVNHDGTLGLSVYLNLFIGPESAGLVAPPGWPLIQCEYWEEGHPLSADNIVVYTQVIDITDTLLSGGTSAVAPFGAASLPFNPAPGLRFWRPVVRLSIPGVVGAQPGTNWVAWGMVH